LNSCLGSGVNLLTATQVFCAKCLSSSETLHHCTRGRELKRTARRLYFQNQEDTSKWLLPLKLGVCQHVNSRLQKQIRLACWRVGNCPSVSIYGRLKCRRALICKHANCLIAGQLPLFKETKSRPAMKNGAGTGMPRIYTASKSIGSGTGASNIPADVVSDRES